MTGRFLYLDASDLPSQTCEKEPSLAALAATLVGLLFVFIVSELLGLGGGK